MLRIVVQPDLPDERSVEVKPGAMTIGRTKDNDVFVLHKSLSRTHARLEHGAAGTTVEDLGSKNGTFVNGARVTRSALVPGDLLRCGDVSFVLRDDSAPQPRTWAPSTIAESSRDPASLSLDDLVGRESSPRSSLRLGDADAVTRARVRLEVLLRVSQLLSKPHTLDQLLDEVLSLVLRIMDVDRVALLLRDEATSELSPRLLRSARGAPPGRFYSEHIVRWVRDHGVAALFSDPKNDARVGTAASILDQSICSSMCAPLLANDRLLGVLYVDNLTTPDRFTPEDLEFLGAFASQAAGALENATLWRRLEDEAVLRSTLTRFFPPATIRRLTEVGGASLGVIETEVTALFSDISGFTAMSSAMSPRAVVDMLNEYFPLVGEVVFRHGGTLEKYIGDALMAVWGAPFADPDDADHAVAAAVEMQRGLADLNGRRAQAGRPPIHIHVGVNTGPVAAGNIGSDRYLQYATIGDATNMASRACSAAAAGQIVITEATRARLRASTWQLTALPPTPIKGKDEPLRLHAVRWER